MAMALSILGTAALAAGVLLTLLVALSTSLYTMRAPSGPDAMGLAGPFFAMIAAWIGVLIAALVCVGRGSFDWISRFPGIPTLAVILTVGGLGVAAMFAAGVSLEQRFAWRTPIGLAGALFMPLLVQGFILALLWMPPQSVAEKVWPRAIGWPLAVAALAMHAVWIGMWIQSENARIKREIAAEAESAREEEKWREEQRRWGEEQDAILAAIPQDAPLKDYFAHLFINYSEDHHAKALARIAALPDLHARMVAALAAEEPMDREYAANYLRMCAQPDQSLAPALARAIELLAADYRRLAENPQGPGSSHPVGLVKGMVGAARRFPDADFDAPFHALRDATQTWPDPDLKAPVLEEIDAYLAAGAAR